MTEMTHDKVPNNSSLYYLFQYAILQQTLHIVMEK